MAHDIFISHASANKEIAGAVCRALESSGIRCWIAPRDVKPGAEYAEEIMNGIEDCKIFLLIFSNESNTSAPVAKELENALRYDKIIIPFRTADIKMRKSFEYYLSNLHWLDADPDDSGFTLLIEAIKKALGVPVEPSLGTCPRCGSPVRESGKGYFCDSRACDFKLWKENKFWTAKKKPLTAAIVAALLKDGQVKLTGLYSEKTGKTYNATILLDDDGGKYVNFKMEFDNKRV